MGFINIFFASFLCALSLLSTGRLFNKLIIKKKDVNFFESLIYGFIFISFFSLLLNFFTSLNQQLNSVIIIILLIIYFLIFRKHLKTDLILLLIISFLSVLIMSFENINRPDGGLYHFPFINILNDEKLIVGLSNLHFRYGHISIIQYISSIYNNYLFTDNGTLIPPTIIFFSLLGYFLYEIFFSKSDKFYKLLSLLFVLYILINMNRYSSWGNDDFASIIFFIVLIESYKFLLDYNLNTYSKITLLCTICFLIKTFYLIIFLVPVVLFFISFKKIGLGNYFNRNLFFCFVFITLWLIRGFLSTSCLIFPIEFTCYENFDWSLKEKAILNISIISEAWSKDWPNFELQKNYKYDYYISNFNWLSTWIKNHFIIILKNLSILIPIIFITKFYIKIDLNTLQKKFINSACLVVTFFTLIWFLKFPILRYGEGILVSLVIIISFYLKFSFLSKDLRAISFILIIIFFTGVFLKNTIKFYSNFNKVYVDYPWPKKNTFSENNKKNEYVEYLENGDLIYVEPKIETNLCMYGKSPCAATDVNKYYFEIDGNLVITKGKFLIFDTFKIINN